MEPGCVGLAQGTRHQKGARTHMAPIWRLAHIAAHVVCGGGSRSQDLGVSMQHVSVCMHASDRKGPGGPEGERGEGDTT